MEIFKFYILDGIFEYIMAFLVLALFMLTLKLWEMINKENTLLEVILNRVFSLIGIIVVFILSLMIISWICYTFQTIMIES